MQLLLSQCRWVPWLAKNIRTVDHTLMGLETSYVSNMLVHVQQWIQPLCYSHSEELC